MAGKFVCLFIFCVHFVITVSFGSPSKSSSKCEPITIPMCQDVPYNQTRMPNLMGHQDQAAAAIEVHEFKPLVEMGCSRYLKFFLCSIYAPMCADQVDLPIPACQTLCLEVKNRCAPVLKSLNFPWPEALQCDKLPMPENGLCMEHPDIEEAHISSERQEYVENTLPALNVPQIDQSKEKEMNDRKIIEAAAASCPTNFAYTGDFFSTDRCSPLCQAPAWYSEEQLQTAEACLAVGSAMGIVSGVISLVIAAKQGGTSQGLVMIGLCQLMVMAAMVIRAAVGREASSCEQTQLGSLVLVTKGQHNTVCNTVALLAYVGWIAGLGWWLCVVFIWWRSLAGVQLAASGLIHGIIWGGSIVAGLLTYTTMGVEADPLTGMCSMNEDLVSWVLPSGAFLIIGMAILILGTLLNRQNNKTGSANNGIFCLLFFIPSLGLFIWETWIFLAEDTNLYNSPNIYKLPGYPVTLEVLYTKLFLSCLTSLVPPVFILVFQLQAYLKNSSESTPEAPIQRPQPGGRPQNIYQESTHGHTINTVTTNCTSTTY